MKKLLYAACTALLLLACAASANAFSLPFQYYRTYQYSSGSFTSTATYFTDISDSGRICGYYLSASGGNAGLVYFKNGKTITYSYPGYSNTEFSGINDHGYIVGRAYNTVSAAIAIRAQLQGDTAIVNVTQMTFYGSPGDTYLEPRGLNNNNVTGGTLFTGTTRWINYTSVVPPVTLTGTHRYESGPTVYNTYGLGLADSIDDYMNSGYYLNGTTRVPVLYGNTANTFYLYSQVNATPAIPATLFNDVNNNNDVAVSYKDNSGFYQGTVGHCTTGTFSYSATYETSFPFTGAHGSEVLGINNRDDIVGDMTDASGVTTAYFATVSEYKIPGFSVPQNVFSFGNKESVFGQSVAYNGPDPYLTSTSQTTAGNFFQTYLSQNPQLSSHAKLIALSGYRYPTWPQYVFAVGEDSTYITINGAKQARMDAIDKWLTRSDTIFNGYCFGMSLFGAQFYDDPQVLVNRFGNFTGGVPANVSGFATGSPYLVSGLRTDIGALQLYQWTAANQANVARLDYLKQLYNNNGAAALYDTTRKLIDAMTLKFYDVAAADSTHILGIWARDPLSANLNAVFRHAVYPYKIARNISTTILTDTLYALDPNYDSTYTKIVINYTGKAAYGTNAANVINYAILTAAPCGQLAQLNPAAHAVLAGIKHSTSSGASPNAAPLMRTYSTYNAWHTNDACSYRMEDATNAAHYFQKTAGGAITNSYPGIYSDYIMDADSIPDVLMTQLPMSVKTTLTGCGGHTAWSYEYPAGTMIFARDSALAGQNDIAYNNGNILKAENPDAVAHLVSLTAIPSTPAEESTVMINSFRMDHADTATLTVLDLKHLRLANGEASDKYYNLHVRYLGTGGYVTRDVKGIHIYGRSNHTIVIQPTVTGREVIILVDSQQNNTVDDTLLVSGNNATGIVSTTFKNVQTRIYPNPAQHTISVSLSGLNAAWQYRLTDITGRTMAHGNSNADNILLPLDGYSNGIYFIELRNAAGALIHAERFVKE